MRLSCGAYDTTGEHRKTKGHRDFVAMMKIQQVKEKEEEGEEE